MSWLSLRTRSSDTMERTKLPLSTAIGTSGMNGKNGILLEDTAIFIMTEPLCRFRAVVTVPDYPAAAAAGIQPGGKAGRLAKPTAF